MSLSTRFRGKLPLFSNIVPLSQRCSLIHNLIGCPSWTFCHFLLQKKRRFPSGFFLKKMTLNMEKRVVGFENSLGLVNSATEFDAAEAFEAVKAGKVIAVLTDTVYGFACDACSSEAVNWTYEIKGRKHTSPLAICLGDVLDINHFAVTDHLPHGLLDPLLPGSVTIILGRSEFSILKKSLNPGLDSIGVRVPDSDSDFIRVIARRAGSAVALTSANLSGQHSREVVQDRQSWTSLTPESTRFLDREVLACISSAKEETVAILEKCSLIEEAANG